MIYSGLLSPVPDLLPFLASVRKTTFPWHPGQATKIVLLPATKSRFLPKKTSSTDDHHADIEGVVDREDHEVVGQDQRNMNEGADAENQEMHHDADIRRAPSPKPEGSLVLFEIDGLKSIGRSRDFGGTGIRKLTENPGA
jgi:hypothetical protein